MAASFPLMFSGLREAVVVLLKLLAPSRRRELDIVWRQDVLSIVLLTVIGGCSLVLTDACLVVNVAAAISGSMMVYIVPSTLYAASIKCFTGVGNLCCEILWLRLLTLLGIILGASGC